MPWVRCPICGEKNFIIVPSEYGYYEDLFTRKRMVPVTCSHCWHRTDYSMYELKEMEELEEKRRKRERASYEDSDRASVYKSYTRSYCNSGYTRSLYDPSSIEPEHYVNKEMEKLGAYLMFSASMIAIVLTLIFILLGFPGGFELMIFVGLMLVMIVAIGRAIWDASHEY